MDNPIWPTYFFSIIQWCWTVSVRNHENLRWRKDFERCFQCGSDEASGFITWNEESCILYVGLDLCYGCGVAGWWVFLEKNQERCEGVADQM